ncbi:MAG: sodium:proton antiporter [Burkholderiales bacterium]
MTNTGILAASALLLFAYAIEHLGRRFKLPAVVLLIGAGLAARQVLDSLGLKFHWVDPIVPVLGTLGLILIVLEGALDLTVTRERAHVMVAAAASSLLGFCLTLGAFAILFVLVMNLSVPSAMLASIPFAVISSAVAIPSASALPTQPREFVVYESSLSDILGVLVFYSWLGANGSLEAFATDLFGGGALSLVAALLAAIALFYFINQITGNVRFLPLLAGLVLLYAVGKELHLSPLIVVLVCGLLINNPHLVTWHSALRNFQTPQYEETLSSFKALVAELTFACKSFFFLLLGYWTEVSEMLSVEAWLIAIAGISFILFSRYAILALLRRKAIAQLVWIAPRGLITVLLFLSARRTGELQDFPFGSVMLVVLVTSALTALAHRAAPAARAEEAPPLATAVDPTAPGTQSQG